MERRPTSYGWIVFWFFIFWPVGVVLLIKRINENKIATLKNSYIERPPYIDATQNYYNYPYTTPPYYMIPQTNQAQDTIVFCKGCGAAKKAIAGQMAECDYCGSHIV